MPYRDANREEAQRRCLHCTSPTLKTFYLLGNVPIGPLIAIIVRPPTQKYYMQAKLNISEILEENTVEKNVHSWRQKTMKKL